MKYVQIFICLKIKKYGFEIVKPKEFMLLLKEAGYDRNVINAQLKELIKQNKVLEGFEK